ncbi:MAG: outer membrane protein assembly factor BamB family protein [Planctomycetota bacterium]|jgi:outer membrane protein assembly factor BamB
MSLKGNLASVNLTEIFQMLSLSGREGTLFVYEGARKRAICFTKDGVSIRSRERNESNLIGKILVRMGKVDENDLQQSIEQKRSSSRLLGDMLVENGSCTKEDVEAAFRIQSQEDIQELFLNKTDAQFEYVDGYFPETEAPFVDLNVNSLLIEIARRTDEWEYIRRRIRGPREIYRFTGEEGEVEADVLHECYAHRVDALIDGTRAVGDIIEDSYVNKYEVCKLLANYLDANVIEAVPADAIRQNARLALRMGDSASAIRHYEYLMSAGDFTLEVMAEAAEAHESNRDFAEAAALLRRLAEEMVRDGDERGAIDALRRIANYPRPDVEALRYLLDLVFANPRAAAEFSPHIIEAGKTMVAHYIRCEQRPEAHALLEKLVALYVDEIAFAVSIVNLYYDQGNVERAASECERMAHSFLKRKRVSPAVSLYKKLLVIDPERQDIRDKIRKIVSGKRKKSKGGGAMSRAMVALAVALLLGGAAVVLIRHDGEVGGREATIDPETLRTLIDHARADSGMARNHSRAAMREYARLLDLLSGDALRERDKIEQGIDRAHQNHDQFNTDAEKAETSWEMIRKQSGSEADASMARTMLSSLHDDRSNIQAERAKWQRRARISGKKLHERGRELYEEAQLLGALDRFEMAKLLRDWPQDSDIHQFIRNIRQDRDKATLEIEAAEADEAAGRWVAARRKYLKLIDEFRTADIIEGIRLPLELVTVPPGATIYLDGNELPVKTPHVVRLAYKAATTVRLAKPGYKELSFELGPFLAGASPEDDDHIVHFQKKPTWQLEVGDRIESSPVIWDGKFAAIGRNGAFAILSAKDGSILYRSAIKNGEGFTAGLVAEKNHVFATSLDRQLYIIDATRKNAVARKLPLTEGVYATPLLRDKTLYVADMAGIVIAIDPLSARPKWPKPVTTSHGVSAGLALVAQGEDLVVTTRDGRVTVLRRSDGTQMADYRVRGPLSCAPALVGDDDLIFASEDGWLQSWVRVSATLRWEEPFETSITHTPPVRGRGVFVSPKPREFVAIDVTTGSPYFRYRHTKLSARVEITPKDREFALHGRTLFAFGQTKSGYGPAWYFEARGKILTAPIVVDGAVYIGDDKGYVYRLEANDE